MTWFSDALRSAHRLSNSIGVFRNLWWLLVVIVATGVAAWRLGRAGGWCVTAGIGLAALGVATFAAGVILVRRASVSPYSWEWAEYTYQFDSEDPRRQVQTTKIKIRANRDDVALFRNRYYWTGQGESRLRSLNGHRVVAEGVAMDSVRRYYYVLLEKSLNRGDTAVIHIRQELYDARGSFQPVLAKSLYEPVGRLSLRVIYPVGWEPRHVVTRELVRSRDSDSGWRTVREWATEIENTGDASEAVYVAHDPRIGRQYALYWGPWDRYSKAAQFGA